jgi:uncharacterized Tic20 family protein
MAEEGFESQQSGPTETQPAEGEGGIAAPSRDAKNLAMLAHLLGIFTGFLVPLIIWLIKKDEDAFIDDQAKEALNFQITATIALIIASFSIYILIGCVLFPAVLIADLVLGIMAAMAASRGEQYRYPVALRLVQ